MCVSVRLCVWVSGCIYVRKNVSVCVTECMCIWVYIRVYIYMCVSRKESEREREFIHSNRRRPSDHQARQLVSRSRTETRAAGKRKLEGESYFSPYFPTHCRALPVGTISPPSRSSTVLIEPLLTPLSSVNQWPWPHSMLNPDPSGQEKEPLGDAFSDDTARSGPQMACSPS